MRHEWYWSQHITRVSVSKKNVVLATYSYDVIAAPSTFDRLATYSDDVFAAPSTFDSWRHALATYSDDVIAVASTYDCTPRGACVEIPVEAGSYTNWPVGPARPCQNIWYQIKVMGKWMLPGWYRHHPSSGVGFKKYGWFSVVKSIGPREVSCNRRLCDLSD